MWFVVLWPGTANAQQGFGGGGPLVGERARIEAAVAPDHLDAVWSIATTTEARIRSAFEGVRARERATFLSVRGKPARARQWRLSALEAVRPIWHESVMQIEGVLSSDERSRLAGELAAFRAAHPRMNVSDPPVPGGYAGLGVARSSDVGGFVLRVLLRAREE
jgi:hypothetical protein